MARMHAHSTRPTMNPVANTAGMVANSPASGYRYGTVLLSGTTNASVAVRPGTRGDFVVGVVMV